MRPVLPFRTPSLELPPMRRPALLLTALALPLMLGAFSGRAELRGAYKIEIGVNDQSYGGTFTVTPKEKNTFSAAMAITTPSTVNGDFTGSTKGDSVFWSGKYNDTSRNCSGSMSSRGVQQKDGSVTGVIAIDDSCAGAVEASLKLLK
jgi:hypothetical protein